MTPQCASACPTCLEPLPEGAFAGPCEPCRIGMRERAEKRAANRRPVVEPQPEAAAVPSRPIAANGDTYDGPVGHCVHCLRPVYGEHAESEPSSHPCCAFWIETVGFDRCYACQPISGRIPAEPPPAPPAPTQPPLRADERRPRELPTGGGR